MESHSYRCYVSYNEASKGSMPEIFRWTENESSWNQWSPNSMEPGTSEFCPQCNKLDFNFFRRGIGGGQQPLVVSWNELVESCRFCQLLSHCVDRSTGTTQSFQGTLNGLYTGHELQLYTNDERLGYSVRLCASIPAPCLEEKSQISTGFDVEELKTWLDQCEIHQCLPLDHWDKPLPESLRLINVVTCCIERPKTHVKYCALSYVWGAIRLPADLTDSDKPLQVSKLPQTILDAIYLCRQINCDYLWVDSLCISNCKEDKHRQIRSMTDVYSQSFLAIIACAGDDADAGLPPYGSFGRRCELSYLVRQTSQGSFVASLSPQIAAEAIAKSTWASRGWTLQEYALSRRVLFFTGSYAFLRCELRLCCEDFGLGFSKRFEEDAKWDLPLPPFYRRNDPVRHSHITYSQMLSQFIRRRLSYNGDILAGHTGRRTRKEGRVGSKSFEEDARFDIPLTPFYRRKIDPTRHYPTTYSQMLAQFVRRRLTFKEDILAAFTGILTRMESTIGSHIWGLPSTELGAALQWTTGMLCPGIRRDGFPSWSWTGWMYEKDHSTFDVTISDMYKGFDEKCTNISTLTCYQVIGDEQKIHCFEKTSTEAILTQAKAASAELLIPIELAENALIGEKLPDYFTPPAPRAIQTYINSGVVVPNSPLSHHIFLWASCAKLFVDLPTENLDCPTSCDLPIRIDEEGPQIGSINLSAEWRKGEVLGYMDFFVSTLGVHCPPNSSSLEVQLKVKIVLVKERLLAELPVYERVQISYTDIHLGDWASAHPQSRFIALV